MFEFGGILKDGESWDRFRIGCSCVIVTMMMLSSNSTPEDLKPSRNECVLGKVESSNVKLERRMIMNECEGRVLRRAFPYVLVSGSGGRRNFWLEILRETN